MQKFCICTKAACPSLWGPVAIYSTRATARVVYTRSLTLWLYTLRFRPKNWALKTKSSGISTERKPKRRRDGAYCKKATPKLAGSLLLSCKWLFSSLVISSMWSVSTWRSGAYLYKIHSRHKKKCRKELNFFVCTSINKKINLKKTGLFSKIY